MRPLPMVALAGLVAFLPFCGCSGPSDDQLPETDANEVVFATVPPLAYLVERIGAGHIEVEVLVKPGSSPETYAPTPGEAAALARAPLCFIVGGLPFEDQLAARAEQAFEGLAFIETSAGFTRRALEGGHSHHGHSHGHSHAHDDHASEETLDPHVWLSPAALKIMANHIADALCAHTPKHTAEFRAAEQAFLDDLAAAGARIAARLKPYQGRAFYVFHGAFGYFAEAYGLREVSIETGGKRPEPRQLQNIIEQAKADGVRTIFVQPQFDRLGANAVARGIGASLAELDPLAGDVVANLEAIAESVAKGLDPQS